MGSAGFRLGVVAESARSVTDLLRTSRRAEELGFDTVLLRDHLVTEPFGDQLAPMVALAAVAASTTTIRLGTMVLSNDFRHPVVLAKEVTTLDQVSGRRFELGLGAGWLRDEYERAGLPFDRAGTRVDRLRESLLALDQLLSGRACTLDGSHYSITDLPTFPVPARRPPIMIGAGSPRMLRLAGEHADIVGILPRALPDGTISGDLTERTHEAMARKVELVREGAGDRFDEIELSQMISFIVADDHRAAAASLAARRGWDVDTVLEMPSVHLGSAARIVDQMHQRRERYGFSYLVISDVDVEAAVPILEQLDAA